MGAVVDACSTQSSVFYKQACICTDWVPASSAAPWGRARVLGALLGRIVREVGVGVHEPEALAVLVADDALGVRVVLAADLLVDAVRLVAAGGRTLGQGQW